MEFIFMSLELGRKVEVKDIHISRMKRMGASALFYYNKVLVSRIMIAYPYSGLNPTVTVCIQS